MLDSSKSRNARNVAETSRGQRPRRRRDDVFVEGSIATATKNEIVGRGPTGRVKTGAAPASIKQYAASLADPFRVRSVRSPCLGNIAPTVTSFAATTSLVYSSTTAINSSVQVTLFGGHAAFTANSDPTSNHSYYQRIGALVADYMFAPFGDGARLPAAGVISVIADAGAVPQGVLQYSTNTAASTALTWDNPLPLVSGTSDGNHTRWRLVSMGVRFVNTTPAANRAGEIITVNPDINFLFANGADQGVLTRFATYQMHESGKPVQVAWIPRAADLGYSHTGSSQSNDLNGWGMMLVHHNGTAVVQSWTMEIIANWEIAGYNVKALSGYAPTSPTAHAAVLHATGAAMEGGVDVQKMALSAYQHYVQGTEATLSNLVQGAKSLFD